MMTFNRYLFSSASGEWETPQDLFDELHREFHFTLDPCASHDDHKCDNYYTVEDNGLSKDWTGNVFVNPPYGREIGKWMKKALIMCVSGICLLNKKYDPIGAKLDGWDESVMENRPVLSPEKVAVQESEIYGDWRLQLDRTGKDGDGPPKNTLKNLILILENALGEDVFSFNEPRKKEGISSYLFVS